MCDNNMRRHPGMVPSRVRAATFPIALPRIPRPTSVHHHRLMSNFISDGGCSNRADIHTTIAFVLRIIGAPPRMCGIRARACVVTPTCRRHCQSGAVCYHAINF